MSTPQQISYAEDSERGQGLRRRMLDAAQRIVRKDGGLTVSLENLSMDRVIREAGVSRSSAYREWANKDAFNTDLLCDLAGPDWQGSRSFDDETLESARNLVADNLASLETEINRKMLIEEIIRLSARRTFATIATSTQWRTNVVLKATALTLPEGDTRTRVSNSLRAAELLFLRNIGLFYADMATVLGYRLRNEVTDWDVVAAAGVSVIEGLALREMLIPELIAQPIVTGEGDQAKEWHIAAITFLSVTMRMIEPDPEYQVGRGLADYLKRLANRLG